MNDQHTIASLRNFTARFTLGWAVFTTFIAFLLCVIAFFLQVTLTLLQAVSSTAHEIMRLYSLQPSLIQLFMLLSLVVLSVWGFTRLLRALLRAGAAARDVFIDEMYRYRTGRGRFNGR